MKIKVIYRSTYGHDYYEPECETAKKLLLMCDPRGIRKVFTQVQVDLARELGFTIEIRGALPNEH